MAAYQFMRSHNLLQKIYLDHEYIIIQLNEFADMNNFLLTPKGIVPTEIYNLPETEPSK